MKYERWTLPLPVEHNWRQLCDEENEPKAKGEIAGVFGGRLRAENKWIGNGFSWNLSKITSHIFQYIMLSVIFN